MEKGKIGVSQFTVLVILFSMGSTVLIIPTRLVHQAKQDAWISAILGLGIGLLYIWFYNTLAKQFSNLSLIEMYETVFGKWFGKVISLLFIAYYFIPSTIILREIGDFMTTSIMPETPIESIEILFISVVIMGTRLGLETLARTGEILFPWTFFLFFILLVCIFPEMKLENIQPVLENGIKPVLSGAYQDMENPYMQLIIFMMFFPHVTQKYRDRKFIIATAIGGITGIIVTFCAISVLGVDVVSRQLYPSYTLAKQINIADFITRIEAVMAGIWIVTIYFKFAIAFYGIILGIAQILNLKDTRSLTLPMGVIFVVFSLLSPNHSHYGKFINDFGTLLALTYGFLFPLILLLVAKVRKI